MKVLILGGTGTMGTYLVQQLATRGLETTVTSRQAKTSTENVRYIQGNARDMGFLKILLAENWDVIVDFMLYSTTAFAARVHHLLESTSQYVFISSARVYAESNSPIREESPRLIDQSTDQEFLATDEYSLAKARQEDLLIRSGRKNWTIVRPYITYGENRLQLGVLEKEEWLYRALRGRTIVLSKDILSRITTLTHSSDVANGICILIGNEKALSEVFQITSPDPIGWHEVLELYTLAFRTHLGFEPKIVLQDMDFFMQSKSAKYQIAYDRLYNRRFDSSKIKLLNPTQQFVDVKAGLSDSINCFLRHPVFSFIDWKFEAIRDSQVGEWANLGEIPSLKQKLKYSAFRLIYYVINRK